MQKIFSLGFLTEKEIRRIHLSSLEILEKKGIKIYSEKALRILGDYGANIDLKKLIARIPGCLVEEALDSCPKSFTLCGRDPKFDMRLDGNHKYKFGGGEATITIDLETGKRRNSKKEDAVSAAIISDFLEGISGQYTPVVPLNCSENVRSLHEFDAVVNNTEKHYMSGSLDNSKEARLLIEMGAAVMGGKEELKRRPIFSALFSTFSPLALGLNTEAAIEIAKANIPIDINPMPMLGASAPLTLAAGIVLGNAQFLAMLTLIQKINRGTPVLIGPSPMVMEMRTGAFIFSFPEAILVTSGMVQMARYYNIRTYVPGFVTSSRIPGIQAAYENAISQFVASLVGSDLTGGIGMLENQSVLSFEQMLIDYEIYTMIEKILRGIEISDETMALDLIYKVDHKGTFMTENHTLKHMKECYFPTLSDPRIYEAWKADGAKTIVETAREKAREIIKKHQPSKLDTRIKEKLLEIIKKGGEEWEQ